jgi:hypothetical protein
LDLAERGEEGEREREERESVSFSGSRRNSKTKKREEKNSKTLSHPLQPLPGVREPVAPPGARAKQVLLGQHPEPKHVVGDGAPECECLPLKAFLFFIFLKEEK